MAEEEIDQIVDQAAHSVDSWVIPASQGGGQMYKNTCLLIISRSNFFYIVYLEV